MMHWFVKADDDTWVFVDNLRTYLANYDEDKPHYMMGLRIDTTTIRNETFLFGGTGA